MSNIFNKTIFVDTIMSYLQDRFEKNDIIRLRDVKKPLTVDEVYSDYLEGVQSGYAANLSFKTNLRRTSNGEIVQFSLEEKKDIFDKVRDYLMEYDISDYPDVRGDDYYFIITILGNSLKGYNNITDEMQEKVNKYIVALDCLRTHLSFHNEIEGFIVKDKGKFFIEDHKKKDFIKCTLGNMTIEEYTKVVVSDNVYVVNVIDRETGEEDIIFKVSMENNSSFEDLEEKYIRKCVYTLHSYLEENDCLFLEHDLYDEDELNTVLKDKVSKYITMNKEEKEKIEQLSKYAASWLLGALETVNFCSPKDVNNALESGYLNQFDLETFQKEEALFRKYLQEGIKEQLITKDFVRISLDSLYHGIFRRVRNKCNFYFEPMYLHLDTTTTPITYEDCDGNRVTLVPEVMKGFEGFFTDHDFRTQKLFKEMDIYDGNIFFENDKRDKVVIYSLERDYKLSRKPIDINPNK